MLIGARRHPSDPELPQVKVLLLKADAEIVNNNNPNHGKFQLFIVFFKSDLTGNEDIQYLLSPLDQKSSGLFSSLRVLLGTQWV